MIDGCVGVVSQLYVSTSRFRASQSECSDSIVIVAPRMKKRRGSSQPKLTLRVPVYDDPNEDLYKYFDRCADAIASEAERGGRTIVYCKNGRSRSATVCVAYLMKHKGLTLTDAFQIVKSARPVVEPNPGFWTQLEQYEHELKIRRPTRPKKRKFFNLSLQGLFPQRGHST